MCVGCITINIDLLARIQNRSRIKPWKRTLPVHQTLDWKTGISEVSGGHAGAILDPGRVPLPGRWSGCEVKYCVTPAEHPEDGETQVKCRSLPIWHWDSQYPKPSATPKEYNWGFPHLFYFQKLNSRHWSYSRLLHCISLVLI